MTRSEFQILAEIRLKEAETLLAAGFWDGAYYLAGYAVEFGLKACIAKRLKAEDVPNKGLEQSFYVHKLEDLFKLASQDTGLQAEITTNVDLEETWNRVKKWREQSRYVRTTETDAKELIDAVSNPQYGVLAWIRRNW